MITSHQHEWYWRVNVRSILLWGGPCLAGVVTASLYFITEETAFTLGGYYMLFAYLNGGLAVIGSGFAAFSAHPRPWERWNRIGWAALGAIAGLLTFIPATAGSIAVLGKILKVCLDCGRF